MLKHTQKTFSLCLNVKFCKEERIPAIECKHLHDTYHKLLHRARFQWYLVKTSPNIMQTSKKYNNPLVTFERGVKEFLLQLLDNFTIVCRMWTCGWREKKIFYVNCLSKHCGMNLLKHSGMTYMLSQKHCDSSHYQDTNEEVCFLMVQKPQGCLQQLTWSIHAKHIVSGDNPLKNLMNNLFNAIHPSTFGGGQAFEPEKNLLCTLLPYLLCMKNEGYPVQTYTHCTLLEQSTTIIITERHVASKARETKKMT